MDASKHNDLNRRGAIRLPDGSLKSVYVRLLVRKRCEENGNLRVVTEVSSGLRDVPAGSSTDDLCLQKVTDSLGNTHLVAKEGSME